MQEKAVEMAGGRSLDPNYKQVSGHVPKEKLLNFKIAIASEETTLSEALEQSIDLWLAAVERGDELPKVQERVDKRRVDEGDRDA